MTFCWWTEIGHRLHAGRDTIRTKVFSTISGLDDYGEPSFCSMHYDLWINNPHCNNEYPDYTYEDHFGKSIPAYVPRAVVRDHLEGNTQQFTQYSLRRSHHRPASETPFEWRVVRVRMVAPIQFAGRKS